MIGKERLSILIGQLSNEDDANRGLILSEGITSAIVRSKARKDGRWGVKIVG